jgi:hypothetical protein
MRTIGPRGRIVQDDEVVGKVKVAKVGVAGEVDGVAVVAIARGLLGLLLR